MAFTANWDDAKRFPQEFENADEVVITDAGALVFYIDRRPHLIVAPGDWHELTYHYYDEE